MADSARLPWSGQAYSVKRHGATIANCDSEPVRTPGCIQAHGALLVLRLSDGVVLQVSENSGEVLGVEPEALLGSSFESAFGADASALLKAFLLREPIDGNPLYAFSMPARAAGEPLDLTVHGVDGLVVVEFEATGRSLSTQPDYYALVKKTVARLQGASGLRHFCEITAAEFRELTGLDRVMVYRFHEDGHGEVYAESRRPDLSSWLGLHYPAEDIPKPARDIFTRIWVRPLPDVDGALAELVPLVNPDTGQALDMTHCALRGPSVMYTEYLRNMQVSASLTLSLRRGDTLWGLIAGHHVSGPRPINYQVRAACEFLAQVVSLQHQAAEDREHEAYRARIDDVHHQLIAQAASEGGLAAMADLPVRLADGIACGGAAIYHRERWWRMGETPDDSQLDALARWLVTQPELALPDRPLFVTDELGRHHPPARAFADIASGLLAVPLSLSRRNLLLWFRPETIRTIDWAGNPQDKPTVPGPNGPRLTPRVSFELFRESVRGRSRPWLSVELNSASRLRQWVMELVVTRAERLAELNADLARSNEELDAFAYVASHDLKEPLRGINKYAHQLIESHAVHDDADRRKLESLMRLTVRMDSLLESLLHFSRVGRVALELDDEDLNEIVAESIEMVSGRTDDARAEFVVARPLPRIRCDRIRVREIFTNLISNALKYNDQALRRVIIGYSLPGEAEGREAAPPGATGQAIFFVRDNGIGIDARHHEQIFRMFKRLHGRDAYGGGTGAGLTIVRRLVARHDGQIWLQSVAAEGSCFYFTLPGTERQP